MSTKANPSEFDCYAAAGDEEEIFTLRANDPLASHMVRIWARAYQRDFSAAYMALLDLIGESGSIVRHSSSIKEKAAEAIECADRMAAQNQGRPTAGRGGQ